MAELRVRGLHKVNRALARMEDAVAADVIERAGLEAVEPMLKDMRGRVPVDRGDLKRSIGARTANKHSSLVIIAAGAATLKGGPVERTRHAWLVEYGTATQPPQPFARPAFDANVTRIIRTVGRKMWREVRRAGN